MPDFKSLKLAPQVQKALTRLEYTTPTPIQQKAIPDVLAGKDLMGIAQTGTGKTAAFSLPTLSHIANNPMDPPKRGTRVLILAPTRELASQIAVSVRDYGVCMPELTVACVFGGVPIHRQIKKLVRGNDVLVATPGRLIDLIGRKDVRLGEVEVLILDEADQMMDMGFIHALRQIIPHLPQKRQTLFFSATMTPPIKKLASQFLTDPVQVSVAPPNTTAEKIDQSVIFVDQKEKQNLLALKLLDKSVERALIFTRTKHGADRVVKRLAKVGIKALAIHGNKSQSQRQRALASFREAEVRFLVATDIAARGIDIEGITHVINFEIPNVPEQYVHRIGRTARAGREGRAVSFVADGDERQYLKRIQKLLTMDIPRESLPEDFLRKSAEVNKRPALPRPKPMAHKDARKADMADRERQRRRRRPKQPKKPKTAEQEMAEVQKNTDQKSGKKSGKKPRHKSRPPHPDSPKGRSFKRKKRPNEHRDNDRGDDRSGSSGGNSGGHSGGKNNKSEGRSNHNSGHNSGHKSGHKPNHKPGGKPGHKPGGKPKNRGGGKYKGKSGGKSGSGQNRRNNSHKPR